MYNYLLLNTSPLTAVQQAGYANRLAGRRKNSNAAYSRSKLPAQSQKWRQDGQWEQEASIVHRSTALFCFPDTSRMVSAGFIHSLFSIHTHDVVRQQIRNWIIQWKPIMNVLQFERLSAKFFTPPILSPLVIFEIDPVQLYFFKVRIRKF